MSPLKWLDRYEVKARLFPALLVLLPPLLTVVAWFGTLLTSGIGSTLVTLLAFCGVFYLLTVLVRSAGKRLQRRLLRAWGGWPTTLWLRHSDGNLDEHTKGRYHAYLGANSGVAMPTPEEEAADLVAADAKYGSASAWLKEHNWALRLVADENIEYGFRRNVTGSKPMGLALALVSLAATLAAWLFLASGQQPLEVGSAVATVMERAGVGTVGAALFDLVTVVFWLVRANAQWVREAGDTYAQTLLRTCDNPAQSSAHG